jgi:hypothetical protein
VSVHRLEPHAVIVGMFKRTWDERRVIWDMATVPIILSVAIHLVFQFVIEARGLGVGALMARLCDIVPTTMFLVAWQRYLLMGPNAVSWIPGLSWTARETRYLLQLLSLAALPLVLLAMPMMGEGIDRELLMVTGLPAIVSALFALRLCFGLPAAAVDVPWLPADSWRYGKGNGFAILGIVLLPVLVGAVVMAIVLLIVVGVLQSLAGAEGGPSYGRSAVIFLVSSIMSYAQTAVIGCALALIFQALSGFRPGAPLQPPP